MNTDWLVSQMTLREKCDLLTGADFWRLKATPRLNVPSVATSDGPHGLRKQVTGNDHLSLNESLAAVAFPTAAAVACSFDRALARELGEALGDECQAEDVAVILGPGANLKRSPLCGRNFEYFSEDPLLSGKMAGAQIQGLQSRHVGASLKHFAVNNQETRRMSINVEASARAIRELYLASFEYAVREGRPWTVMCSYNKIDGVYSSENRWLLTDVLRGDWGFDGFTVTDWGALNDHVQGVIAGMDLVMPGGMPQEDEALYAAVQNGTVPEPLVDEAAKRILNIVYRYVENHDPHAVFDREKHHRTARKIAGESMVLLKNRGGLLPFAPGTRVAVLGAFASEPRYQGAGSSHINAFKVVGLKAAAREQKNFIFADGYHGDEPDEALLAEAEELAKGCDAAVLMVGLPDSYESEGFDRTHMRLPESHLALIRRVNALNPRTVVVLHNGSPVELPFADDVAAIVETYLGGQAVGEALLDVLTGTVNPSGKLAETFPLRLEHTPCHLNFPGDRDTVRYAEGLYVGYRYYEKKALPVRYPFGFGLSYTTFAYGNLRLSNQTLAPEDSLTVSAEITNTGERYGKEIVQLYLSRLSDGVDRPLQELKGFEKIGLQPGETASVTFTLTKRDFSYWEESLQDWFAESGMYEVRISAASDDIRLKAQVRMENPVRLPKHYTSDTVVMDIPCEKRTEPRLRTLLESAYLSLGGEPSAATDDAKPNDILSQLLAAIPLHALKSFSGGRYSDADIAEIVRNLNSDPSASDQG